MKFLIPVLILPFVVVAACGDDTSSEQNDWNVSQNDDNQNDDNQNDDNQNDDNQNNITPNYAPNVVDCPDPSDPEVLYFDIDTYFCEHIDVECGDDAQPFDDECGCGCIRDDGDYRCGDGEDSCPGGTYCHIDEDLCGEEEQKGYCQGIPTACTDDWAETCGCDGEVYLGSSTCAAPESGATPSPSLAPCVDDGCPDPEDPNVTYMGLTDEFCASQPMCGDDEQPFDDECGCGCIARDDDDDLEACDIDDCPSGYYCYYADEVCGDQGADGVCNPKPSSCTGDMTDVCGCDGEIYTGSSTCAAQENGVDSSRDGAACE